MFATVAYNDNAVAPQTDTDLPALTDPSMTIVNGHFIFQAPVWVQMVYGLGATLSRLRLTTPRLRTITRVAIAPVDGGATVPNEFDRAWHYYKHPIMLNPVEETQILRTSTGAGAERDWCILNVGDNNRNVPQGDMYTARATTAFTPTNFIWSNGAWTFDDTLEVGRYSVIGLRVNNAGGIAARIIFPGAPSIGAQNQIRPGTIVDQSDNQNGRTEFRYGIQGEYGQFESYAQPQIDVLTGAAAANPEVFCDIVPVRLRSAA